MVWGANFRLKSPNFRFYSLSCKRAQSRIPASAFNLRSNCDDSQRTAGTAHYLQRGCDDDGSCRRKLIQVAKAGQAKLAAAVHEVMVRKRRLERERLASIGPNRLHADPQHVSVLSQQFRTLFR